MPRASEPGPSLWLPALACMAVAAALRWPTLGVQSLWIDEIYSADMTTWDLADVLSVQDGHPPLYALLQILLAQVMPAGIAGRVISAIAGVIGVGLLVHLGTVMFDRRTGIVAGLLLAVSPLHVWYSQEGRMYALVVMLAITSSIVLARAMRHGGAAWMAFAIVSLCGIFTHYLYAGLIVAQGLFLLLEARLAGRLLAGLAAAAAIAIAAIPVLGPEATSFVGDQRGFEWMALPYVGFTFIGGFGLGPPIEALHRHRGFAAVEPYWPAIVMVATLGIVLGLVGWLAARRSSPWGRYAILWAAAPILFSFAGSWIRDGAFNVRYTLIALPAVLLVIARGLTDGKPTRLVVGAAAMVVLSLVSIARERADGRYAREDLRSAARFLAANAHDGDQIMVSCSYMRFGLEYYDAPPQLIELPVPRNRSADDVATNLRALTTPTRPTWLVLSREWEDDPRGLFADAFTAAVSAEPAAQFPGVRIYRFLPASGSAIAPPSGAPS